MIKLPVVLIALMATLLVGFAAGFYYALAAARIATQQMIQAGEIVVNRKPKEDRIR